MDWQPVLEFLKGLAPWAEYVLMGLGSLVVMGGTYVRLTPSKKDDVWWAKLEETPILGALLKALVRFSPVSRRSD